MKGISYFAVVLALAAFAATASADTVSVTTTGSATTLVGELLGPGISVVSGSESYTGAAVASGTFSNGLPSGIGISSGILLTSGDASLAPGPNNNDAATGDNGLGGDAALTTFSGYATYDATVLQFDFTSTTGDLYFQYVFASEEYNEWTNSQYNDVFAFFLDGENLALIPGTSIPVAINNVNGGNPLGTGASNPAYYKNNDLSDGGPFYDIQYDGFTTVFTASKNGLTAGTHTIRLAIADGSDRQLDSAVFIAGGSFSGTNLAVPLPAGAWMGFALLALLGVVNWRRRRIVAMQ